MGGRGAIGSTRTPPKQSVISFFFSLDLGVHGSGHQLGDLVKVGAHGSHPAIQSRPISARRARLFHQPCHRPQCGRRGAQQRRGALPFLFPLGLDAEEIAKLIVFCGVTVGLGLVTLAGLCLILLPGTAGKIAGLGNAASVTLGMASLALGAVYLALATFVRGELKIRSWRFALPPLHLAALQILVGTVNFAFVAACLHQLLNGEACYMETTAAYVVGNLTALVSHVPGGLGVLEATIAFLLGGSASIGSMIAFRVIYFFIPLPLGLLSLLASETFLGSSTDAGLRMGAS